MEAYQTYIENLINELSCQKIILSYCCNEIQQAMKRLESYSLMKREIEKQQEILQTQNEIESVDFEEVDNLISKAQQLILKKHSKQPSKSFKSSTKVKSAVLPTSKTTVSSKDSTKVKTLRKPTNKKSRAQQCNSKLISQKYNNKKETGGQSTHHVVETKELPEPYKKEFATLLNDCKRYKESIRRHTMKHKADTHKEKMTFLNVIGNVEKDQKPCYIKKSDFVDEIFEKFDYQGCFLDNGFSNLKETLIDRIEFNKQSRRLEYLLTHSKLFRQLLLDSEIDIPDIQSYRLIHWQLTKSLPVLIVDDDTDLEN